MFLAPPGATAPHFSQNADFRFFRKASLLRTLPSILILFFVAPAMLYAAPAVNVSALPKAPDPAHQSAAGNGVITGTLKNSQGKPLPNAPLRIYGAQLAHPQTARTNAKGVFRISGLAAGNYHLQASANGYLTVDSPMIVLGQGEVYHLTLTATALPKSTTTVTVRASVHQIATAQIHQEEKQRVLGVIPNFSTSYEPNPAPLTTGLKYNLAWHIIRDPFTFGVSAAVAGMEQEANIYPGYGSGWQGFGKRLGASYGDAAISRVLGDGVFSSLLHQDPRYFYKGTGGFGSRFWYAVRSAVVVKGDNGHWQPAYAKLLGSFSAAGISNLYHTPQDRTAGITVRDALILTGGDALENIVREFLSKSLTSHLPANVKH